MPGDGPRAVVELRVGLETSRQQREHPPLAPRGQEWRSIHAAAQLELATRPRQSGGIRSANPDELHGRRARREAPDRVALVAVKPVDDCDDPVSGGNRRLADVVRNGNARTDEMVVIEGPYGHVLPDPLAVVLHPPRRERARLVRRYTRQTFAPASSVEPVEHGCAPVHRPPRRPDRQDGGDLLGEAHPAVVRIPDIAHADRFLRSCVEVPVLPVEERVLRNGRRARQRESTEDHHGRSADSEAARTGRQAGEQEQRAGKDDDPSPELVAAGEERRRPPRADEKGDHCRHRPACRNRKRHCEREREDRDQHDLVHAHELVRVEGKPVVVEVEEAALEAPGRTSDVERRHGEGDAAGEECRHRDGAEACPPRTHERRCNREHDERERPAATRPRVLEAQPVDGDHEPGDTREDRRPKHARPPAPPAPRARPRDRLRREG